jgi:AcrR family transcriptional regulator
MPMTPSDTRQDPPVAFGEVATGVEADVGHRPNRPDTRQRILDVALDLFTEHGYDGTSLREIADQLGISKAALYYYFQSKEDIFLALHMRLHEFGKNILIRMGDQPVTLQLWSEMLNELIDQILPQRQIFLMHLRNEATLEKLHNRTHDAENEDIQNRLRLILSDPKIRLGDRVRMAASVGVLFSSFFLSGDAFAESSELELGSLLREVLHDVLST